MCCKGIFPYTCLSCAQRATDGNVGAPRSFCWYLCRFHIEFMCVNAIRFREVYTFNCTTNKSVLTIIVHPPAKATYLSWRNRIFQDTCCSSILYKRVLDPPKPHLKIFPKKKIPWTSLVSNQPLCDSQSDHRELLRFSATERLGEFICNPQKRGWRCSTLPTQWLLSHW
jgi:hypothetical protein